MLCPPAAFFVVTLTSASTIEAEQTRASAIDMDFINLRPQKVCAHLAESVTAVLTEL
jgi:hypothetical protein